jgi:single-strand DNA-binding protein
MKSFNHVVFIGNVGRDPEERTVNDDVKVCDFSLAVDEGKDESPLWLSVTAWRKLAEQVKAYVHKGDAVLVSGRLSVRAYTDKSGVERTAVEVTADDILFLTPKGEPKELPTEDAAPPEPAVTATS